MYLMTRELTLFAGKERHLHLATDQLHSTSLKTQPKDSQPCTTYNYIRAV